MYSTVTVFPWLTDRMLSPFTGATSSTGNVPTNVPEPGESASSVTVSGAVSESE